MLMLHLQSPVSNETLPPRTEQSEEEDDVAPPVLQSEDVSNHKSRKDRR